MSVIKRHVEQWIADGDLPAINLDDALDGVARAYVRTRERLNIDIDPELWCELFHKAMMEHGEAVRVAMLKPHRRKQ